MYRRLSMLRLARLWGPHLQTMWEALCHVLQSALSLEFLKLDYVECFETTSAPLLTMGALHQLVISVTESQTLTDSCAGILQRIIPPALDTLEVSIDWRASVQAFITSARPLLSNARSTLKVMDITTEGGAAQWLGAIVAVPFTLSSALSEKKLRRRPTLGKTRKIQRPEVTLMAQAPPGYGNKLRFAEWTLRGEAAVAQIDIGTTDFRKLTDRI
ncbi:hypothetical protein B0H17DRAFT_1152831 [Mycena rosella]|uniref:Uncharacterized protein n=1 Tax=Mycena rosella TaxID=1033263 RepID=A0AAD7FEK0_MYCRO|nr:hypothetical protein B0H17DRAFT_1152831 [Mycena rosella]